MGVGSSLEIPYVLRGPLPAGSYALSAGGYQSTKDAMLHADLIWRRAGSADQILGSSGSNTAAGSDAGAPGDIHTTLSLPAVAAACGDQLVLRVKLVSGASDYIEFGVSLAIP